MRLFALIVATCALSQAAIAQTQECKSIRNSARRLACYDKAAPAARSADAPPSARVSTSEVDNPTYVDTISTENALMDARVKNICRGC